MRVILEADLFDQTGPGVTRDLVQLLTIAYHDRHFLEFEPLDDPRFERWLSRHEEELQRDIRERIGLDLALSANRAATRVVRIVCQGPSRWASPESRLTLADALKFIRRPLKVYLENGRNDRRFLLALAGRNMATELERLEEDGAFEVVHGGGLPELHQILKGLPQEDRIGSFAIFDSDALLPGRPSKAAKELEKACKRWHMTYHRLRRRTAENYLPVAAIEFWATTGEQKKKARALGRLKTQQRYHLNLRRGLNGDQDHDERSPELDSFFDDVQESDLRTLATGFGRKVAEAFEIKTDLAEVWFYQDDPDREGVKICDRILAHC